MVTANKINFLQIPFLCQYWVNSDKLNWQWLLARALLNSVNLVVLPNIIITELWLWSSSLKWSALLKISPRNLQLGIQLGQIFMSQDEGVCPNRVTYLLVILERYFTYQRLWMSSFLSQSSSFCITFNCIIMHLQVHCDCFYGSVLCPILQWILPP